MSDNTVKGKCEKCLKIVRWKAGLIRLSEAACPYCDTKLVRTNSLIQGFPIEDIIPKRYTKPLINA